MCVKYVSFSLGRGNNNHTVDLRTYIHIYRYSKVKCSTLYILNAIGLNCVKRVLDDIGALKDRCFMVLKKCFRWATKDYLRTID